MRMLRRFCLTTLVEADDAEPGLSQYQAVNHAACPGTDNANIYMIRLAHHILSRSKRLTSTDFTSAVAIQRPR